MFHNGSLVNVSVIVKSIAPHLKCISRKYSSSTSKVKAPQPILKKKETGTVNRVRIVLYCLFCMCGRTDK